MKQTLDEKREEVMTYIVKLGMYARLKQLGANDYDGGYDEMIYKLEQWWTDLSREEQEKIEQFAKALAERGLKQLENEHKELS